MNSFCDHLIGIEYNPDTDIALIHCSDNKIPEGLRSIRFDYCPHCGRNISRLISISVSMLMKRLNEENKDESKIN